MLPLVISRRDVILFFVSSVLADVAHSGDLQHTLLCCDHVDLTSEVFSAMFILSVSIFPATSYH